jgi:pyrroloquinoline quinone (PQQ) biosynthesis protein C
MRHRADSISNALPAGIEQTTTTPTEQPRSIQPRRYHRGAFSIPVCIQQGERQTHGTTLDFTPGGLRLRCRNAPALAAGSALNLTFQFGETCNLSAAAQVAYRLESPHDDAQTMGIRFAGLRDWEQTIILSALKELSESDQSRQTSLITIHVGENTLANEAAQLHGQAHNVSAAGAAKTTKGSRKLTPDPAWIVGMKRCIEPAWNAVLECPLVQEASAGTLPLRQMRAWLIQLYPFIETFPKWIALSITKIEDPVSRGFMIDNIRVEKRHAEQWVYMAQGFGISPVELYTVQPIPEVDALTHWLWSINTHGTVAEAVGATNYAIEGVTQGISKLTVQGFPYYDGKKGVRLDKKAYWWMEAHARYDDLHPVQALEVMKRYASTKEQQEKVTFAVKRSLEYMLMALQACYSRF